MSSNKLKRSQIETGCTATTNNVAAVCKMRMGCVMVSPNEAAKMIGASPVTLWRWERKGNFPKRTKLSPGKVAWRLVDIQAWLLEREAENVTTDDAVNAKHCALSAKGQGTK